MTYDEIKEHFNEIISSLQQFGNDHEENFAKLSKTVVQHQYAVGGELMHRGYYCPSLVLDVYVGNARRGRIIKKATSKKITYTYGIDEAGRLATVIKHTEVGDEYEYIIYKDNVQYGATFFRTRWGSFELHTLSRCCYCENKLKSYENYRYRHDIKTFFEYDAFYEYYGELYDYSESEIDVQNVCFLRGLPGDPRCTFFKFFVVDGYITEFTDNGVKYLLEKKKKVIF